MRAQHYASVNKLLNTEQPYLFAFAPAALLAAAPDLRGLRPGTFSPYADVERWWLQK